MDLLLIIRGLAAVSVVYWHSVGYQIGFHELNVPGRTAVWVFFGISGYVIGYGFINGRYAFSRDGILNFYRNRILRIYPLFLTLSLSGWLLAWYQTGQSAIGFGEIPSQLFAIQFMQDYKLNSVFWTLGLELQFYLLAPLLVYLVARRGDNPSIYISGLAWLLYCVAVDYPMRTGAFGWNYDARHIIGTLPHFLIGILGCQWSCKFKPNARVGLGALIVALILLVYSDILYHLVPGDYWSLKGSLIVDGTILMMIVAHVKLEEVILKGAAASGAIWILEWSGKLSYGVYAWHALLMHASATLASEFWLVLPLSFLAAYVTYLAVERPALTLKRWNDART